MKKIVTAIMALSLSVLVKAQQEISMDELSKHTGDSVKVCTKIFSGIYLERSKGAPTLLDAGGKYPDAPLTLLIWGDNRKQFKEAPDSFYKDKNVCITGRIKLYKGKPEIEIYDEKQIEVGK
jgi:micrococcal nuclease